MYSSLYSRDPWKQGAGRCWHCCLIKTAGWFLQPHIWFFLNIACHPRFNTEVICTYPSINLHPPVHSSTHPFIRPCTASLVNSHLFLIVMRRVSQQSLNEWHDRTGHWSITRHTHRQTNTHHLHGGRTYSVSVQWEEDKSTKTCKLHIARIKLQTFLLCESNKAFAH